MSISSRKSIIQFYYYNKEECVYEENASLKSCAAKDSGAHVKWLNILGIEDKEMLHHAAELFNLHPLVVEDILNPNQRAKIEDYNNTLYVVLRMFALVNGEVEDQQVSIVLRDNMVLTFREAEFGVLKKNIGDKIVSNSGNIRRKGEDYLLYTLLDVIIDQYYLVIEHVEDQVEKLEQAIFRNPHDSQLVSLQHLKSDVLYMRKHIVPVRDLITNLIRNEIEYFEDDNKYYLRDLQDHMTRDVEELDFLRDQLSSLMDLYYSLQAHKMNNIIKTLTSVSFVLLPLTFIATIYGMNFKYMPRVDDPYGFWEVIGGMGVISLFLLLIAVRRKWISTKDFRGSKN